MGIVTAATGGATGLRYYVETALTTPPTIDNTNFFKLRNNGCTIDIKRDTI